MIINPLLSESVRGLSSTTSESENLHYDGSKSKARRNLLLRAFNLNITVKGPRDRIYISKDVIRALGVPPYICIKINEDMSALAIEPSEEKEYMSFKVPEKLFDSHKHEFTVHSKSFVHELIMANGLDTTKNYPLRGVCAQNGNAILFKMNVDLHGTGDL